MQRVRVQLPGTSAELLNKFREKKIDFAAHSNTEDGGAVFLNLLGECMFRACTVTTDAQLCINQWPGEGVWEAEVEALIDAACLHHCGARSVVEPQVCSPTAAEPDPTHRACDLHCMPNRGWISTHCAICLSAGNLAFPLLLVGGLFLLSRRSGGAGGMGGPGGNNPLAFGKSKARFQMEPNTGVTFEDVAGVDEAKQDFMEVCGAAVTCGVHLHWLLHILQLHTNED